MMARELEDAILSMRTNELDIGVWLIKHLWVAMTMLKQWMQHWLHIRITGSLEKH
jgi:benzoyl-CoA-dihydrodiol lyase